MVYSRWSSASWSSYSSTTKTKPAAAIFTSRSLHNDLDPKGVLSRESRDSDLNPKSTAIIIGVDVTGSMGIIAEYMVKTGLGILFQEILDRKPVTDPHLMVMAIGDAVCDSTPLQVSQFEADIKITEWLEKIYIEGCGGGNDSESYHLPLYFAANHTSIDCFEKRGKKGYLFTIGDEMTPPKLTKDQIKRVCGDESSTDLTYEDLLEQAERMYEVFHIIVAEGNFARRDVDRVKHKWQEVLGQRAIVLTDYKSLSEVIVSIIQVNEGADTDTVTKSWSGDTSLVVKKAVSGLTTKAGTDSTGVILID
jgi:hypothetical protein